MTNTIVSLFTQTFPSKALPKWTKWTELDQMPKLDQSGPNWTE